VARREPGKKKIKPGTAQRDDIVKQSERNNRLGLSKKKKEGISTRETVGIQVTDGKRGKISND